MRFIVASISLICITFAVSLLSSQHIVRTVQDTSNLLQTAIVEKNSGNNNQSLEIVKQASDQWKNHETIFGTLMRHDEIDDVTVEFARLEAYACTEDQDDFISNCAAIIAQLHHIMEKEKLKLGNIM